MTTYSYTFPLIKHTERRRVACRECGKKFARQRTFTQTQSPFNKNAKGEQASYTEIRADLRTIGEKWQPIDLCGKCMAASLE